MNVEEIMSQKLGMTLDEVRQNSKRIDECNATYYWNPIRGGVAYIVADNGDYLGATSSVSFERLLEEFKRGERNKNLFDETKKEIVNKIDENMENHINNQNEVDPQNDYFTSYVGMDYNQIKELINDKFGLISSKISGNNTDLEKSNPGLLLWGCKQILENILFACNKLVNKFNGDISKEELDKYSQISQIIQSDNGNWNSMGGIKATVEKIKMYF